MANENQTSRVDKLNNQIENQKNQPGSDEMQRRKIRCAICRPTMKLCTGHGGGGSGGGDNDSAGSDDSTKNLLDPNVKYDALGTYPKVLDLLPPIHSEPPDYYKANDLILYFNKELTLTFRGNSNLSQAELQKLFDAILDSFEQFKTELLHKGILVENFSVERSETELNIHIPDVDVFEKFMEHLANNKFISHELVQQYKSAISVPHEVAELTAEEVTAVGYKSPVPKPRGYIEAAG